MKINLPRLTSEEFKLALAALMGHRLTSLPEKFIVEKMWAVADDGRELLMPMRLDVTRLVWDLDARNIEPAVIVKIKALFCDGATEETEIGATTIGGFVLSFTVVLEF